MSSMKISEPLWEFKKGIIEMLIPAESGASDDTYMIGILNCVYELIFAVD